MNQIIPPLKRGEHGPAVARLQDALRQCLDRGVLATDDKDELRAALKRERDKQTYGDATGKLVGLFQQERKLQPSGEVDEPTAAALNKLLHEWGWQTIEGTVILKNGLPAKDLKLRLYQRKFGGKAVKLDETTTDADGRYALTYDAGGRAVSLEVRAVKGDGSEIPLSGPLNDLTPESRADLTLVAPAGLQPLAFEYHRLSAALEPHVKKMANLAAAREDAERQDLTVLSLATGWDARLIALASFAEKLAAEKDVKKVGLSPEGLYGLLRAGLPSDKLLLAQVEPKVIEVALKQARDAGIVKVTAGDIKAFTAKFAVFAKETRPNMPVPGSHSTYRDFLDKAGLKSRTDQEKFLEIFVAHAGDANELWKKAKKAGLKDKQIKSLQLQGKLAFLTSNSVEMTAHLQKGIQDPGELVGKGLYTPEAWEKEAQRLPKKERDAAIPLVYEADPALKGDAAAKARLRAWAEDMALKVRLGYPTQVMAHLIEKGPKEFKSLVDSKNFGEVVKRMKEGAEKGFRIGETPVTRFFEEENEEENPKKQRDKAKISIKKSVLKELQALQRVYRITPGDAAMPILKSMKITSAHEVTAYTEPDFVERYAGEYAKGYSVKKTDGKKMEELRSEARLIYGKSRQVSAMALHLVTTAKLLEGDARIFAMTSAGERSGQARSEAQQNLTRLFPTVEKLFGSGDFCECEHCRSVLSPAAYLVDLLQFLDAENGADRPYDVLIDRRPDLPHIALTCANTHTALPYIDIVNEILEYYVANEKLEKEAARDTGDAASEDLLAEPRNVIRKAYKELNEARYPLNLPFDPWIETVRRFCDYFETPLHEVLEAFRKKDDLFAPDQTFDRAAIFMESLGLSPAEAAIFTGSNPLPKWHELYGFQNDDEARNEPADAETGPRTDLNSAKALSRRLGVTYMEIVEIVGTGFVNPELGKLSLLHKLGVSIRDAQFYKDHKALYGQHKDLVDKEREELASQAERDRFDGLFDEAPGTGKTKREIVNEVAAFERRLETYAARFPGVGGIDAAALEGKILGLDLAKTLMLLDPPGSGCDFDKTLLQYVDGAKAKPIDFLRINLFVRLWRKLGWSIEETDRALQTFVPKSAPFNGVTANLAKQPLKTALIYLAHLKALEEKLKPGKDGRLKLLTLWSDIPTTGANPLYARLFLTPNTFRDVPDGGSAFDHPLGEYLEGNVDLKDHVPALQGALGLTADEIDRILADADLSPDAAKLSLPNVSLLYRYGLLAKALKLTVRELIALKQLSGLDPFKALHPDPLKTLDQDFLFSQTLEFVKVVGELKDGGLKIEELDYWFRHRDERGQYRRDADAFPAMMKTLVIGIQEIRRNMEAASDFSEESLKEKLSLLWPPDTVDSFLAAVTGTGTYEAIKDAGPGERLEATDFAPEPSLTVEYDGTRGTQKLAYRGMLTDAKKDGLAAAHSSPLLRELLDAVQRKARQSFAQQVKAVLDLVLGPMKFTAVREGVEPHEKLDSGTFKPYPALWVRYDEARKTQWLGYRGLLLNSEMGEIKSAGGPSDILDELLEEVQFKVMNFAGEWVASSIGMLMAGVEFEAVEVVSGTGGVSDGTPWEVGALREFFRNELTARVAYDAQARTLRLTYTGFLDEQREESLLEDAAETGVTGAARILLEHLLENLKEQSEAFLDGLKAVFVEEHEDFNAYFDGDEDLPPDSGAGRSRMWAALLPFARETLARRFAARTAAENLGVPHDLVETLLGSELLRAPGGGDEPLYHALDFDSLADVPADASSKAYLEVPVDGAYRFFVRLDKRWAKATLRLSGLLPDPVLDFQASHNGDEKSAFVELKRGVPYALSLEMEGLRGGFAVLEVQGENLPRGSLGRLSLFPGEAVDNARQAWLLLAKSLRIIQALGLNEAEILHLSGFREHFAGFDFHRLPVNAVSADAGASRENFEWFRRLLEYRLLKRDTAGDADDLMGIFRANESGDRHKTYSLVAGVTRREEATVKATAEALFDAPAFASEKPLWRLWEALRIVERFGASPRALSGWTRIVKKDAGNEERFGIARDVRETVKARFDAETWRRVAQPIFDELRRRRRDALVSRVWQQLREKPETAHIDTQEKLYEYFLVDPGMEPVVQTSRIRLAIASVQQFIQRCLLNLEPKVKPSAIKAGRWEWMKRYRVWEANRKIFLYPENWLEPEFRDDKTHLFQELEGALLQGDVSSDLVEDAFFTYVKGLDELARLEMVAMHPESRDSGTRLHVIGRTYGLPHKYFYRVYDGSEWTPWEPVNAPIEGDHLAPVVWRDRLYLFWVTFMDKPIQNPKPLSGTGGSSTRDVLNELGETANWKGIDVQLHWSEYLNGEWGTGQSSPFSTVKFYVASENPARDPAAGRRGALIPTTNSLTVLPRNPALGLRVASLLPYIFVNDLHVPLNFDPAGVFIHVSRENPGDDSQERGIYIHLNGPESFLHSFYLAGRNSGVENGVSKPPPTNPYGGEYAATRYDVRTSALEARPFPYVILPILKRRGDHMLVPCNIGDPNGRDDAALNRPLFYQDSHHAFFVEPGMRIAQIVPEWSKWIFEKPRIEPVLRISIADLDTNRLADLNVRDLVNDRARIATNGG